MCFGDSSGQTDLAPFTQAAYILAGDKKKVFINEEIAQVLEDEKYKKM